MNSLKKQVHSCCVPDCGDKYVRRHCLPADSCLRAVWLHRINNPKLHFINGTKLKNYYVCEKHFDPMCLEENGRLRRYSLPTISLPNFDETSSKENCFAPPVQEECKIPIPEIIRGILSMPKTPSVLSGESPEKLKLNKPKKVYANSKRALFPVKTETADAVEQVPVGENVQPRPASSSTKAIASVMGILSMPKTPSVLSGESPEKLKLNKPKKVYANSKRALFPVKTETADAVEQVPVGENVQPRPASSSTKAIASVMGTSTPALLFEFVPVDTI